MFTFLQQKLNWLVSVLPFKRGNRKLIGRRAEVSKTEQLTTLVWMNLSLQQSSGRFH